jgi:signal transduction histidine kinase/CheY-like chemotaxis protein
MVEAVKKSTSILESELRTSPRPVFVALMIIGCLLVLGAEILSYPWAVVGRVMSLLLLLTALSVTGWLLVSWKPGVGRWFTLLALVIAVHFTGIGLGLSEALALAWVPVAVAAPLIGLGAATLTAVGEFAFILILLAYPVTELNPSIAVIALVAICAALTIMYAVYGSMRQLIAWLEEYFERAERSLEEVQDRRAELEQAMESLAHANRQLALANDRSAALRTIAEEAEKAKTMFVANVSHEFRTPLNMIIGLVDLMIESPEIYTVALSPKMREDLEVVHRNCELLSNMINDVLDLTRMGAGRMPLYRERVSLKQIIDHAVEVARPLLEKKRLALQITIPDDLPEVYCDRIRIQQVILNLVSNAARFTEKGGITIVVVQEDQQVLVSVADTGPGVSSQDAQRIFEPFCQGTGELWRGKGGSGLGLSISKRFIDLHEGRMWLESEPGAGTTFFFTLPLSPPIEPVARPGHQIREDWVWREHAFMASRGVSTSQLAKPRVVVCDETGALHAELARHSNQVELIDTRRLSQAAQELRQCPAHAMVLNTPASDNLCRLVETASQEAPGTPVIGCSVPRSVERAISAGALGYLIKPVARAHLQKAIQAVGKPVRRILVVDDDPDTLQLLNRMLLVCDSTLQVVTASSGQEALDELRRMPPDLMLLDIVMPDMDGWRVLECLRQDQRTRDVPAFFLSAQDPADQPLMSRVLVATMDEGLSLNKLLGCTLEISALLLKPEEGVDLAPV